RLAWQIRRMATRARAALIYVNGPRLLPATALAATGLPVLFHSHSYLFPGLPRKLAAAALRRLPAWVLASCRFVSEPWQDCVADGRISVVLNGVAGPSTPPHRARGAFPVIGCIGRIAPEK